MIDVRDRLMNRPLPGGGSVQEHFDVSADELHSEDLVHAGPVPCTSCHHPPHQLTELSTELGRQRGNLQKRTHTHSAPGLDYHNNAIKSSVNLSHIHFITVYIIQCSLLIVTDKPTTNIQPYNECTSSFIYPPFPGQSCT